MSTEKLSMKVTGDNIATGSERLEDGPAEVLIEIRKSACDRS